MKIHKEGYTLILIFFLFFAAIPFLTEIFCPVHTLFHWILYFACFAGFTFIVSFFRLPKRHLALDKDAIVSPADGKIVVIEKVFEDKYFKEERIQVSIFMSPFNVHVNWFPMTGKVKYYEYHEGRYLVAWHPKSSDANERTTVVLENKQGQNILVRQIAGAVARRIVSYCTPGSDVKKGEQLGFIKFGSRVDLFLPVGTEILVRKNQKVKGLETIIGHFPS